MNMNESAYEMCYSRVAYADANKVYSVRTMDMQPCNLVSSRNIPVLDEYNAVVVFFSAAVFVQLLLVVFSLPICC